MAIADNAVCEYSQGNSRAMRGDLRGAAVSSDSVGSSEGARLVLGSVVMVGIAMGSIVGGMLLRVFL